MTSTLLPTTRAQVSGHRFLRRRVEHGLVLGDIRMIHDPLATRSRALLFGLVEVQASVFNLTDLAYLDDVPRPDNARMPGLLPREGLHGMLTLRAAL